MRSSCRAADLVEQFQRIGGAGLNGCDRCHEASCGEGLQDKPTENWGYAEDPSLNTSGVVLQNGGITPR